jgi:transcriptional regulator with PAS, ATPase and Fis domain
MDLYYRLNVFPITLPPLRERPGDIPPLVHHFVRTYASRHRKLIAYVPDEVMTALIEYDWPDNIRELQNFIERSVILTRGAELQAPVAELVNKRLSVPGVHPGECGKSAHHFDPAQNELGGWRTQWRGGQTRAGQDNPDRQDAEARDFAGNRRPMQ